MQSQEHFQGKPFKTTVIQTYAPSSDAEEAERFCEDLQDLICACTASQSCPILCNLMECSLPGSSVHGVSLGKNTGVGCHALLQGIFSTQGLNSGLPHCRQILYQLSHQGSPTRKRGGQNGWQTGAGCRTDMDGSSQLCIVKVSECYK